MTRELAKNSSLRPLLGGRLPIMKHFHAVFFLLLVNLLLPSLGWFDALADNSSKVVTAGALMPVEHEAVLLSFILDSLVTAFRLP